MLRGLALALALVATNALVSMRFDAPRPPPRGAAPPSRPGSFGAAPPSRPGSFGSPPPPRAGRGAAPPGPRANTYDQRSNTYGQSQTRGNNDYLSATQPRGGKQWEDSYGQSGVGMRGNSNRRPSPPSGDTSWLDPETERRVQEINSAKEAAVRAEDFEAAKRLRRAEETLLRFGDKFADLEDAKMEATDDDNYDRALLIQAEINALRNKIETQLQLSFPKEDDGRSRGLSFREGRTTGPRPVRDANRRDRTAQSAYVQSDRTGMNGGDWPSFKPTIDNRDFPQRR